MRTEDEHVRAEHRAKRNAGVGRRRQPAQPLRAFLGLERVGDIGLDDAHRSAAGSLHETRQKQQPQRARVREDHVGNRRRGQADHEGRPAAVSIGEPSPHRRADQLRDRERRDEQPDDKPVRAELLGVKGKKGNDHQRSDHVDERSDHQDYEFAHSAAAAPDGDGVARIRQRSPIYPEIRGMPNSSGRDLQMKYERAARSWTLSVSGQLRPEDDLPHPSIQLSRRLPKRRRRHRSSDHAGKRDDRQRIGNHLDELRRDDLRALELNLKRLRRRKE